jgi:inhibitor of cysteine peptidase
MSRRVPWALGCAMALLACAAARADSASTIYAASIPCARVIMHVGQRFDVTLDANHSTGYSWQLEDPLNTRVLKSDSSAYVAPKSGRVGASGQEIWTFVAAGSGRALISMKYARPFDKASVAPAKEAFFVVVVR